MTPLLRASKESFIFLKDIYKYLRYNGVEKNNIYIGELDTQMNGL